MATHTEPYSCQPGSPDKIASSLELRDSIHRFGDDKKGPMWSTINMNI